MLCKNWFGGKRESGAMFQRHDVKLLHLFQRWGRTALQGCWLIECKEQCLLNYESLKILQLNKNTNPVICCLERLENGKLPGS